MKQSILALSALSLALSMGAQATTTADVEVGGTISPTACAITLSNDSFNADFIYTDIPAAQVGWDQPHAVIPAAFTFTLSCDASVTNILLRASASQTSSTPELTAFESWRPFNHMSFPLHDVSSPVSNAEAGGYVIFITEDRQTIGDGRNNAFNDTNQGARPFLSNFNSPSQQSVRFLDVGGEVLAYTFDVQYHFDQRHLDQNNANHLTGSVTFEIAYL